VVLSRGCREASIKFQRGASPYSSCNLLRVINNLPITTFDFTAYLKSGSLKIRQILEGGAVEKRLRTTDTGELSL